MGLTSKRNVLAAALVLALAPGVVTAAAIDDVNAGLTAFQRGENAEAVRLFSRAIDANELTGVNLATAHANRGLARSAAGDLQNALADFDRALALNANSVAALSGRAGALRAMGRLDDAARDIDRAVSLDAN